MLRRKELEIKSSIRHVLGKDMCEFGVLAGASAEILSLSEAQRLLISLPGTRQLDDYILQ